jgi:hypothetical protein
VADALARLAELLAPIMGSLTSAERPAFVALAERIAAGRYRAWAEQAKQDESRVALLACADREEEIASRVEAATPGAAEIQARVEAEHPDVASGYQSLFDGLALEQQLALQAQAERTGAATWRAFAANAAPALAEIFHACAALEEESATTLEALVAAGERV